MENEAGALRALLDKQAIHEVLMRYCRAVDRVDRELLASTFHPDGRCEFGDLVLEGDKIATAITEAAASYHLTHHVIGNELVELHGDTAFGEAYYLSSTTIATEDGKQLRVRGGRYVDRLERRDGTWRIADRVVVEDWSRIDPLPEPPPGSSFRPGQQGPADPLYALLGTDAC